MSKVYKKKNSFVNFKTKDLQNIENIENKILGLDVSKSKNLSIDEIEVFKKVVNEINKKKQLRKLKNPEIEFKITPNIIDELEITEKENWIKYLIHRYRYEVYPEKKIIDNFPPYLQIEPSSICNYRCVFCFETDKSFTNKKNGFMGTMNINLFKEIVDQAEGNIEFISLASRGEPLVNKDFEKLMQYTNGKFLNLKINTNASLLDEKKIHAILSSGVKTLVFSADAADEKLYSKLRVNGKLDVVLKNIEKFNSIKDNCYKDKKIITRVSGVKYSNEQDFEKMENFWGNLVSQVAFVDYNPWENIYLKKPNEINKPCSDLWRRMFVWWDGIINPCDTDYKSTLNINHETLNLSKTWKSKQYENLRHAHLNGSRQSIKPCNACNVI